MGCGSTKEQEEKNVPRKVALQNERLIGNKGSHGKLVDNTGGKYKSIEDNTLQVTKGRLVGYFNENCEEAYKFIKILGEGAFGKVYLVEHRKTNEKFACKRISKKKIRDIKTLNQEISLMKQLDHPNTVKLYEVYEDKTYIFLIMEELKGGELFDRILDRAKANNYYSERQVARLFRQVISGIAYCHEMKIVHRDIKPENIIFVDSSEDSRLKLIDFGLSTIFDNSKEKSMTTKIGTCFYMSPEVIKGDYTEKCDIWALGVLLYILVSGRPPFSGENDNITMNKILTGKFEFKWEGWKQISQELKDLISSMLTLDVENRPSANDLLENKWLNDNQYELSETEMDKTIALKINFADVKKYVEMNKFSQAISAFIALRLNEESIKGLSQIFTKIDKNGNGTISIEEFKVGMDNYCKTQGISIPEDKRDMIFKAADLDHNESITYNEFITATYERKKNNIKEIAYQAFKTFDYDRNGVISFEEFQNLITSNSEEDKKSLLKLFVEIDKNGNGSIEFDELMENLGEGY